MSEERTTTVELHQNGTVYKVLADGTRMLLESDFDWTRFDALSEGEVTAAASADPDNPPLTDAELAGKVQIPNVYVIRSNFGLSQLEFAATFGIDLELLQTWETGPAIPDSAARSFLRIIEVDPEGTKAALEQSAQKAR